MLRSIRWKLALAFGLPTVVFLFLLGLYLTSVLESFHLERMRIDLVSQAIWIGQDFVPDILAQKRPQEIQTHINSQRTPNSDVTRILVIDADGVLLGSSWARDTQLVGKRMEELGVRDALAGQATSGAAHATQASGEALYAAVSVKDGGRVIGVLRLSYDLGHVDDVKRQLRLTIGAGTALAGVLLIGLSLWIAYTLVRPLRTVGQAARQVAQGHFGVRATVQSSDEVGQLADDFNHMSARLEEAEQARRHFLADVTHELRAPAGGIKAAAEALAAGGSEDPDVRPKLVQGIIREADRLNRLVEDLTQLVRFETGTMDFRPVETDVAMVARQVHQRFLPESQRRGIHLDVICEANPLMVRGDPDRLAQAVSNLVDNALKYTPSGGSVHIAAGTGPEATWLRVTDAGVGIPPEELPHVFDRSYRGRHSSTASRGGMGLGLAIARAIVETHGGIIAAESHIGRGSVFTIRLPPV
ncbi:MAG: ATP-binding protein [Dehalococcoidia bacterium]|nr:ATP-binding protein [Dehalococcoidia bacterium]